MGGLLFSSFAHMTINKCVLHETKYFVLQNNVSQSRIHQNAFIRLQHFSSDSLLGTLSERSAKVMNKHSTNDVNSYVVCRVQRG